VEVCEGSGALGPELEFGCARWYGVEIAEKEKQINRAVKILERLGWATVASRPRVLGL
jgi:hypothetical protein